MAAKAIMFQGTGSDVGKSLLVAGLCRLLARRGLRVAPFKAQNMSNNAAIADGGEIGRAQYLQAFAAGIPASVHMNPVLLKPQTDRTSQVIVRGKLHSTQAAADYHNMRGNLMPAVLESYRTLAANADIILVEGAGSPAETNLRANDIANMGFAQASGCPVVLIGDIDRGGVIASLVGTHTVLDAKDREMIRGFIVNKFRGDPALFTQGAADIRHTSWKNIGLVPYHRALLQLPQEDSLALTTAKNTDKDGPHVVVLTYPYTANFDDLDPLANEPNVRLTWLRGGEPFPDDVSVIVLPGSKSSIADLLYLRAQGWDKAIAKHAAAGGHILGICGGYQLLGNVLSDPHAIEGPAQTVAGLGLLDVETIFTHEKITAPWQGRYGEKLVTGFEIHCGRSTGEGCKTPVFLGKNGPDGARTADDKIWGTYVHGLFVSDDFRAEYLQKIGAKPSGYRYFAHIEAILDEWADVLEQSLDIEQLLTLAQPVTAQ